MVGSLIQILLSSASLISTGTASRCQELGLKAKNSKTERYNSAIRMKEGRGFKARSAYIPASIIHTVGHFQPTASIASNY